MTNFPQDFKNRMQSQLGSEWEAFDNAHLTPSPTSIRINSVKSEPPSLDKIPWTSSGYYLPERPSFTHDPLFHAGRYYVQEASSMFIEHAFRAVTANKRALRVLDLCAAPGGKSTHLLSMLDNESLLVSNEVIRSRVNVLGENIQKWGYDNVVVTSNDASHFAMLHGYFDVVVVDAPCSGEGLFRKDPSAMSEWSSDNVAHCALRQQRILEDVWPALKTGGHLIYSTCTYSPAENEDNMKWLMSTDEATAVSLDIPEDWNVVRVNHDSVIGYRMYPHRIHGEGFFLSVIRKDSHTYLPAMRSNPLSKPSISQLDQLKDWLTVPDSKSYFTHHDEIRFVPESLMREVEWISKKLYIHQAGTPLATSKHNKQIPSHGAALSIHLNHNHFGQLQLDHDLAIRYLKKEALASTGELSGFVLVTYQNAPLGWGNALPNRLNNLYPSEWRIRH